MNNREKEKTAEASTTVRSVERAVDLLETLMSTAEPLSLTELSERAGLHPSTAHRLLATLEMKRFVHQNDKSKQYTLGPRLNLLLVSGSQPYIYLRDRVTPILQDIAAELGENVSFSVRNGYKAMLLVQTSSGRLIDVHIKDTVLPLHCTAAGKVILAHLPHAEVRRIMVETGMPALTSKSITVLDELEDVLQLTRQQGYATDMEEWVEGIRCIAVPVFSVKPRVVGAISVSTPASRMTSKLERHFADVLGRCASHLADRIARDIGEGSAANSNSAGV